MAQQRASNPLRTVRVASPCSEDWEQMWGDARVRFCGKCELNVYNLSGMTRLEAESLLASREGRLCVRFYRRTDGTILTKDCPVGLAAFKRRVNRVAVAAISALFSLLTSVGVVRLFDAKPSTPVMGTIAMPPADPPHVNEIVMGDVALPPAKPDSAIAVDRAVCFEPPVPEAPRPRAKCRR